MFRLWNLMRVISKHTKINISLVVELRRANMEREGHFSDEWMNWSHYARVLEAKQKLLAD